MSNCVVSLCVRVAGGTWNDGWILVRVRFLNNTGCAWVGGDGGTKVFGFGSFVCSYDKAIMSLFVTGVERESGLG